MKVDALKASSFFEKLSDLDYEAERKKKDEQKKMFFEIVYQKTSLKDIENVSIECLIDMLDNIESFLGGKSRCQALMDEALGSLDNNAPVVKVHRVI